ncbi:O-acyltransferase like protein isoform X2 [Polypterus senegalus]|uniref:O-acyltransferase like protein isoform X2 n=1 Tax=Polypterus senegalus TaxID=55291 RepID=UPI0019669CF0|nr:O-acyltransferase like protein isoform X2 [Polypterus senegalus]
MLERCLVILLMVVSGSSFHGNITQRCFQDTIRFLEDLNKDEPSPYAVLMYDAFGKMGSDFTGGNMNRLGSLSECLSADAGDFKGQYCQVVLKQGKMEYIVGLCVPSTCKDGEVEVLVIIDIFQYKGTSLIAPVPSVLLPNDTQGIYKAQCLENMATPDASAIVCLLICLILAALPLSATLYVAVLKWKSPKSEDSSPAPHGDFDENHYGTFQLNNVHLRLANSCSHEDESSKASDITNQERRSQGVREKSFFDHFMATISLQNTAAAVLSAQTTGRSYSTLNGIRVLSLLWIISGHTIQIWSMINLDNSNRWKNSVTRNPLNILTIGGPAYLAVDTFLLIGGLLSVQSLLTLIKNSKGKGIFWIVVKYVLNRYKRIQPLHLYTVCLCVGLLPVMQKGSFWNFAEMQTENCKRRWWTNLLLINNFFESSEICIPWSWYLAVDMQLYILTPVLLFVFQRSHAAYFDYYYVMPHARCAPYVVGILLGVFMKEKKEHLLRTERQAAAGWVSTFILLALLIAVPYFLNDVPSYPSASHSIYQGLHRALWAAAVAWIVLACEEGYGGFVQSFLSLCFWRPLSNISFACYMVHPLIIIGYSMIQETGLQYTAWNLLYLFIGHSFLTVMSAFLLTLLVEKPFLYLKSCT